MTYLKCSEILFLLEIKKNRKIFNQLTNYQMKKKIIEFTNITLGPDRLESTILKITGKISQVIQNLLFWKMVDFLLVVIR